jgi:hypothetical protein
MANDDYTKREKQRLYRQSPAGKASKRRASKKIRAKQVVAGDIRLRNYEIRVEAMTAFCSGPPRCQCECGCSVAKVGMLTFDHVNNDGAAHRRELGNGKHQNKGSYGFLRKLKLAGWKSERSIRVMCWNCNSGRANNGGVCPNIEELPPRDRRKAKPTNDEQIQPMPKERTLFDDLGNDDSAK